MTASLDHLLRGLPDGCDRLLADVFDVLDIPHETWRERPQDAVQLAKRLRASAEAMDVYLRRVQVLRGDAARMEREGVV